MRRPIDPAGFEEKYRGAIDPWNYSNSPFEAAKRRVLLSACGDRLHGRGLELGCSIGETSALLTRRCLSLLAVDSSETAIAEAQRRHGAEPRLTFRQAVLPREMPRGPFDLVVISEVAYYLSPRDLSDLLARTMLCTAPGGRIVALHHLTPFDDAAQPPALAQALLRDFLRKLGRVVFHQRARTYEAIAIVKRHR